MNAGVICLAPSGTTLYAGGMFDGGGGRGCSNLAAFDGPPEVEAVKPGSAGSRRAKVVANLNGTGFREGAEVALVHQASGRRIRAAKTTVRSATTVGCAFSWVTAALGYYDVMVENPDGQRGSLPGGFEVIP